MMKLHVSLPPEPASDRRPHAPGGVDQSTLRYTHLSNSTTQTLPTRPGVPALYRYLTMQKIPGRCFPSGDLCKSFARFAAHRAVKPVSA